MGAIASVCDRSQTSVSASMLCRARCSRASSSSSAFLAVSASFAPISPSASATCSPRPRDPPVTSAIFPPRSRSFLTLMPGTLSRLGCSTHQMSLEKGLDVFGGLELGAIARANGRAPFQAGTTELLDHSARVGEVQRLAAPRLDGSSVILEVDHAVAIVLGVAEPETTRARVAVEAVARVRIDLEVGVSSRCADALQIVCAGFDARVVVLGADQREQRPLDARVAVL